MSERREWWIDPVYEVCWQSHGKWWSDEYTKKLVHVREVLPDDVDLLDPRCDDVIELQRRHEVVKKQNATLVKAMQNILDPQQFIGIVAVRSYISELLENEE